MRVYLKTTVLVNLGDIDMKKLIAAFLLTLISFPLFATEEPLAQVVLNEWDQRVFQLIVCDTKEQAISLGKAWVMGGKELGLEKFKEFQATAGHKGGPSCGPVQAYVRFTEVAWRGESEGKALLVLKVMLATTEGVPVPVSLYTLMMGVEVVGKGEVGARPA